MFRWLVDNLEREYFRFNYAIDKYCLVKIYNIELLVFSLTLSKKNEQKKALQIQIKVCEFLIYSKNIWEICLQE